MREPISERYVMMVMILLLLTLVWGIWNAKRMDRKLRRVMDECDERVNALRRALDVIGDTGSAVRKRLQAANEELGARQVQIDSLVRERESLLECNLQLQVLVAQRGEIIKMLSPYQAIRSVLPWGKN